MEVVKDCFLRFWEFLETKEILGIPLYLYFVGCVFLVAIVSYVEGRKKR